MENTKNLGAIIKQFRKKNGLTLREFADKSGLSHTYIFMLEENRNSKTGESITPSLSTLTKIARVLGVSPSELGATIE